MNALVFLQREALGRDHGDFSGFRPDRLSKRIPAVPSQRECQALFAQLSGTNRLMTQLMYGAGLWLMELLRLRVQDVNTSYMGGSCNTLPDMPPSLDGRGVRGRVKHAT